MPKVFISYRRADSQDVAGRLFDHLHTAVGSKNIFKDIDSIAPGEDFTKVIRARLAQCDVVFVLIGPNWQECRDEQNKRRLELPTDYVRMEIREALSLKKQVIPILLSGTPPLKASRLPADIRSLAQLQSTELRSGKDFSRDLHVLLSSAGVKNTFWYWQVLTATVVGIAILLFLAQLDWAPTNPDQEAGPISPAAPKAEGEVVTQPELRKTAPAIPVHVRGINHKLLTRLDELTEVEFADTPLFNCIEYLEDLHEITIQLDRSSLEDEGIDPSHPINLTLYSESLHTALTAMLNPLGCTFYDDSETLVVTTMRMAEMQLFQAIYDVEDLVASGIPLETLQQQVMTISIGEWQDVDGRGGTIVATPPGSISIRQTLAVHEAILEWINLLRQSRGIVP